MGSVLLAALVFLVASAAFFEGPLRSVLQELSQREQERGVQALAAELANTRDWQEHAKETAQRLSAILGRRVTIIAGDGVVLADTAKDERELDNHRDRPEIVEAREHGIGSSARRSVSTGERYLYVAAPIVSETTAIPSQGSRAILGYARIATPLANVEEVTSQLKSTLLMVSLAAALSAVLVGLAAARYATSKLVSMSRIAEEIGHAELGRRIESVADDEVGRLGGAVNLLAERLEGKLVRLTRDRALLIAVLDAIGEGLAFVDEQDQVLAANGAFRKLLGPGVLPEGQRLRAVLPDPALETAVRRAFMTFLEARADATVGDPPREVRFRVVPSVVANVGTVALLITQDLGPNPRVEALSLESADLLVRALERSNTPLPRDAVYALEMASAGRLLDEPPPSPEVVLLREVIPGLPQVAEAPAVYVVRSRLETALSMVRLELGLKDEDPLPLQVEAQPTTVTVKIEATPAPRPVLLLPRSSDALGERVRLLRRQLALALFEQAGAEVEEQSQRVVVRLPRA